MDEDRIIDTLKDEVGLEIERMLAIDPAPALKAQVRARIARERVSGAWGVRWRLASVGTLAVALVMVLVVFRQQREPERASPIQEVTAIPAGGPAPTAARVDQALSQRERPTPPRPRVSSRRASVQSEVHATEAEVLVSPDGRAAFRLFIANIRQARVDPSVLDNIRSTDAPLEPLTAIEPIAIEPLAQLDLVEGDRQ